MPSLRTSPPPPARARLAADSPRTITCALAVEAARRDLLAGRIAQADATLLALSRALAVPDAEVAPRLEHLLQGMLVEGSVG